MPTITWGTMLRTWLGDNETAMDHFRRGAELGQLRGVAAEELMALLSYVGCLFGPGRLKEMSRATSPEVAGG